MLKSEKKVVKLETIKTLADLFPEMTVVDLLEYFEYCKTLSREVIQNEDNKDKVGLL